MFTKIGMRLGMAACLATFGVFFPGCPCANTLQVHDGTIFPITEVYVKFQIVSDYGNNKITGNILPTQTQNIANLTPGRYDVRLVYVGGGTEDHTVDVLCGSSYTIEAGSN